MDNDRGYTPYPVQAGTYRRDQILAKPWHYNDGINTVAIPLTRAALSLIGFSVTVDFDSLEQFANRSVATVKRSIGKGKKSGPDSDPTPAD